MPDHTDTYEYDVDVLYADSNPDTNPSGFEDARDIRHHGDPKLISEAFIESAHREIMSAEGVTIESQYEDVQAHLEKLFKRTEGGRSDDELGYDGTKQRSSYVGDIFILDGTPYITMRIGFEELDFVDLDAVDVDDHHRKLEALEA